jgi:hypothetical protein
MLEGVCRLRRLAVPVEELSVRQSSKRGVQLGLRQGRDRAQQLIGEVPAEYRSDLRHLLGRAESIEASDERVVQRAREGAHGPDA